MIPFKQKLNGILKNAAVLLILLCISNSCLSYVQDTRRTNEDSRRFVDDYQRHVAPKDQSARSQAPPQRQILEASPYVRDVRADSRQSRIDARDIRTDFREIRTELRNREESRFVRDSRIDQNSLIRTDPRRSIHLRVSRDLNNNVRNEESIGQENGSDRRDSRNIHRDNSRQYQNYSRQRYQSQSFDNRNKETTTDERRQFDFARQNKMLGRERDNMQIRKITRERTSEDRQDVRGLRNARNIRERSDDRRFQRTPAPRQDIGNLRDDRERSLSRISQGFNQRRNKGLSISRQEDSRHLRQLSETRRTDSTNDERHLERRELERSRNIRNVEKRSNNVRLVNRHDRPQENRRIREIASARENNVQERYRKSVEQRGIRQNIRERSDVRETRALSRTRDARHNIEDSRHNKRISNEDVQAWSRTLRERRDPQSTIREKREIIRERSEDVRKGSTRERTPLLVDRRNSRTIIGQQAERREIRKEREEVRNSRRHVDRVDSQRREGFMGERGQIIPASRKIETRGSDFETRVRTIDASKNMKFIPDLKEKSDILSNTLQAVLIAALIGQIFFNTSKNGFRFSTCHLFGKEKVL